MKYLKFKSLLTVLAICALSLSIVSCDKEEPITPSPTEQFVNVGDFDLYTIAGGSGDVTVIFEAGMGNNLLIWDQTDILDRTGNFAKILAYNRAGYDPSGIGNESRTIEQIIEELHIVIQNRVTTNEIVLVGHSWGGPIIRAYAIAHPERIRGLLFIDPTHEDYINFTQFHEDMLVSSWGSGPGKEEAEQFLEGIEYISELPNLPDVQVRVLTSMKTTSDLDAADRKRWFNAHKKLGIGVTNFTHFGTPDSGHYIQLEQSFLVMDAIKELVGS